MRKVNATQLIWEFFIGCVIGYVLETLFCFITTGKVISCQGMVFGPFSQIYGFGAIVMALLLMPLTNKSRMWLFIGGALAGGLYEVIYSYLQEMLVGCVTWDYSNQAFSLLGGRTSLIFMLFWGILAVLYIQYVYPWIRKLIARIPRRSKPIYTTIITMVLTADLLLTGAAVGRWSERESGIPAFSSIEVWLDQNFSDQRLRGIYPEMAFSYSPPESRH